MKTKFIAFALIATTFFGNHLVAQVLDATSTSTSLEKGVRCQVSQSEKGQVYLKYELEEARVTSYQADGNKNKESKDHNAKLAIFVLSPATNTVKEVISPRDAASGLPTGKRQHKPIGVSTTIEKGAPITTQRAKIENVPSEVATSHIGGGGGAGKVSMQDISFTHTCGTKTNVYSNVDGEFIIPTGDCPDGPSNLKITWTWADGTLDSNIGSSGMDGVSRGTANLTMNIKDGVCTSMAINEKGLPGEKTKKTKAKN